MKMLKNWWNAPMTRGKIIMDGLATIGLGLAGVVGLVVWTAHAEKEQEAEKNEYEEWTNLWSNFAKEVEEP